MTDKVGNGRCAVFVMMPGAGSEEMSTAVAMTQHDVGEHHGHVEGVPTFHAPGTPFMTNASGGWSHDDAYVVPRKLGAVHTVPPAMTFFGGETTYRCVAE